MRRRTAQVGRCARVGTKSIVRRLGKVGRVEVFVDAVADRCADFGILAVVVGPDGPTTQARRVAAVAELQRKAGVIAVYTAHLPATHDEIERLRSRAEIRLILADGKLIDGADFEYARFILSRDRFFQMVIPWVLFRRTAGGADESYRRGGVVKYFSAGIARKEAKPVREAFLRFKYARMISRVRTRFAIVVDSRILRIGD